MSTNGETSDINGHPFVNPWEIKEAIRHMTMVRYMIENADNKSLTHGEKHHLMQVALMEIKHAFEALHSEHGNGLIRTDTVHVPEPDDIPF